MTKIFKVVKLCCIEHLMTTTIPALKIHLSMFFTKRYASMT